VRRSCSRAERDLVAEVVEAAGEPGDEAVVVEALEVGSPEVVIVLVVAQRRWPSSDRGDA
jgi:hypothetical protein